VAKYHPYSMEGTTTVRARGGHVPSLQYGQVPSLRMRALCAVVAVLVSLWSAVHGGRCAGQPRCVCCGVEVAAQPWRGGIEVLILSR